MSPQQKEDPSMFNVSHISSECDWTDSMSPISFFYKLLFKSILVLLYSLCPQIQRYYPIAPEDHPLGFMLIYI